MILGCGIHCRGATERTEITVITTAYFNHLPPIPKRVAMVPFFALQETTAISGTQKSGLYFVLIT